MNEPPKHSATTDLMEQLHALAATSMKDDLERYVSNGEPIPAQLLSNIIKFLKDNGIQAQPTNSNPLGSMLPALPFPTDAELMTH